MHLQLYGKKIWVYRRQVDFRSSIDGLVSLIMQEIKVAPREGIFLFFNRGKDKVKCLSWHKNGFVLLYKRLESGCFHMKFHEVSGVIEINADELSWLFAGLEWAKMREWKELNYSKFS